MKTGVSGLSPRDHQLETPPMVMDSRYPLQFLTSLDLGLLSRLGEVGMCVFDDVHNKRREVARLTSESPYRKLLRTRVRPGP